MDKLLIAVTNHAALGTKGKKTGLWLRELTDFYHEVKNDFEVDIVSTSHERVPLDPRSLMAVLTNKKTRAYYQNDELMDKVKNPKVPEEVNAADYAAIYFAGGHGTMWDFPDNTGLQDLTRAIYEKRRDRFSCLPRTERTTECKVVGWKVSVIWTRRHWVLRSGRKIDGLVQAHSFFARTGIKRTRHFIQTSFSSNGCLCAAVRPTDYRAEPGIGTRSCAKTC
ncbi:hypothetical protein [Planococcus sp. 107-1]|uniref:hypothetical protein n=1 Tax=Planococcus sp. 107-1 TaxID=2908840 RepID=UPI001F2FCA34|nr:hypothetical protein [Planococcus sp. 107-1]UJF27287.1 hypothetical protein L0M13_01795 [Planococcus sp. 107-1]